MLTFEPALREDVEPIFDLNVELIHKYEDLESIPYDRTLRWVRESVERHLPDFRRILWNGELAGYYCLSLDAGKWELDTLFVLPAYQNLGIGTQILKMCQERASPLWLYVYQRNIGAVRLYRRMGFRIVKNIGGTRYRMKYRKPFFRTKKFQG